MLGSILLFVHFFLFRETNLCNFFMLKRSEQFFGVKMSMQFTNLKEEKKEKSFHECCSTLRCNEILQESEYKFS